MKLVFLMYLDDDDAGVVKLLADLDVNTYSRLPLEGHGVGVGGWYGDVPAYRSRMIFTLLPEIRAQRLMDAVSGCTGCEDPGHPVHAIQVDVEKVVNSGLSHLIPMNS